MPSINDIYESNWLKACAIVTDGESEGRISVPGQPEKLVLTITESGIEEFQDRDDKKKKNKQAVLYFKERMSNGKEYPPLGLNKTNAEKMVEITGSSDTDQWGGHRVEVYVIEQDKADCGYALRIRKPKSVAPTGSQPMTSPSVAGGTAPAFFGGAWATKIREKVAACGKSESDLRTELAGIGYGGLPEQIENWPRSIIDTVGKVVSAMETDHAARQTVPADEDIPF